MRPRLAGAFAPSSGAAGRWRWALHEDLPRLIEIIKKYAGLPADLADV
jgi:hypothetical protein